MNSTLNKIIKRAVALVLLLCVLTMCCACSTIKNIKKTDQICVSGALYESWMYVLSDEEFVTEMVDIFGKMKYRKTDEAVDMMQAHKVISLSFSTGEETLGKIIIDSENRFCFDAGGQAYKITSDFDFDYVKSLVDKEIEEVKSNLNTTPDQV